MNRNILKIMVIFGLIFFMKSKIYACVNERPVAGIAYADTFIVVGSSAYLDGSYSYDIDGSIIQWYWQYYKWNGSSWSYQNYGTDSDPYVNHTFSQAGYYCVELWVKDNGNLFNDELDTTDPTDEQNSSYCYVYVNEVATPFWWYNDGWDWESGPIYVPVNEPIYLCANGNPNSGSPYYYVYFPPGEPTWSISGPSSPTYSTGNSGWCWGGGYDEIYIYNGIAVPGEYTVHAQAGEDDDGEDIDVIAFDAEITGIEEYSDNVLGNWEGGTFTYDIRPDSGWNPDIVAFGITDSGYNVVYYTDEYYSYMSTSVSDEPGLFWPAYSGYNESYYDRVDPGKYYIQIYVEKDGAYYYSEPVEFYIVNPKLTAYKRDDSMISESYQYDPGAFVAYNNDDDDADGGGTYADKYDSSVTGEDDLIKMYFAFDMDSSAFNSLNTGKIVIERTNDKIKLWKYNTKGTEIVFSSNKKAYDFSLPAQKSSFATDIMGQYLWIEGSNPSSVPKDTGIKLSYTDSSDNEIIDSLVNLTVFGTELKTYEISGSELKMDKEKSPGNYIKYNNDDDNRNKTLDVSDPSETQNENDLQKVHFDFESIFNVTGSSGDVLKTGKVVIERSNDKLKLWKYNNRKDAMAFSSNQIIYNFSSDADRSKFKDEILNKDLYVEGANKSTTTADTTDFTLKYVDSSNIDICKDPVKYTILNIQLKEVSFSGTTYKEITKDGTSGTSAVLYSAPHWKDNNLDGDVEDAAAGDKNYPIAYISSVTTPASDSYMKVDVKVYVELPTLFSSTSIKAEHPDGYNFNGAGTLGGSDLSFSSGPVQCIKKFAAETVGYYAPLTLNWKVSLDGGTNWFDVNISDIKALYVTWKDPTPSTLWETPLMIGCSKANTKTKDTDIISAIWTEFTDCDVKRADGKQMTYWKAPSTTQQTIGGMLAATDADGSCIAWSQLLHWCMESQELGSHSQVWTIVADTSVNSGADGFLIQNWNFGLHIRTGADAIRDSTITPDDVGITPIGVNTPCILPGTNGILNSTISGNDITRDGLYNGTNYPYEIDEDAREQTRINAQGNTSSPRYFSNHWVCKIDGNVYDPSYGVGNLSETDHENGAIDGIRDTPQCKKDNNSIPELTYTHDGSKE